NNAGKSSLLRFFYEFRQAFELFTPHNGQLIQALIGNHVPIGLQGMLDLAELYSNRTDRPLSIEFRLRDMEAYGGDARGADPAILTFPRGTNTCTASIVARDGTRLGVGGVTNPHWRDARALQGPKALVLVGPIL